MNDELINIDNLPKRNPYNTYPDQIKLQAFIFRKLNYSQTMISRMLNVPQATLHGWFQKSASEMGIDENVVSVHAEKLGKELSDELIINAKTCMFNAMREDKIEKSSTKDLAVTASIFIDKARLIKGESTNNNFTYIKNQDRNHDELDNLENELRIIDIELNEKRDEN